MAAEVAVLEADDADRAEMLAVADLMESLVLGEVYRLKLPKGVGHEQHGTAMASWFKPTSYYPVRSCSSRDVAQRTAGLVRPEIAVEGDTTRLLVEQVGAVDVRDLAGSLVI